MSSAWTEKSAHFKKRMVICLFAVAFQWGTSLRVATHFASSIIEVPNLDGVVDTCQRAYNVTVDEKERHSSCVESQLQQCNAVLDETIQTEDVRVRAASNHNDDLVRRAVEAATGCSAAYASLRLALEQWTSSGGKIPVRDGGSDTADGGGGESCSSEERTEMNRTLFGTQNNIALQSEALSVSTAYEEESTRFVSGMGGYIGDRVAYDVGYIDQKTKYLQNAAIDTVNGIDIPLVKIDDVFANLTLELGDLMACISADKDARRRDGSKCDPNMYDMLDEFREDAMWKVAFLKASLQDFSDKVVVYKRNVMRAYGVAKRFYEGVNNKVTKWILDTLFNGDWFDVDLVDMTPVDVPFPDVADIFSQIGTFRSIDSMWDAVSPNLDEFYPNLHSLSNDIRARILAMRLGTKLDFVLEIRRAMLSLPDDYNPPVYMPSNTDASSIEDDVSYYFNRSKLFVEQSRSALGGFTGARVSDSFGEGIEFDIPSFNITEIKNKVSKIELNFEDLRGPDVDLDLWFLKLADISDIFLFVDYVFRFYMSLKVVLRYWFATSLALPRIDLRANKEVRNPLRMHPVRAAAAFITNHAVGFFILVGFGVWLTAIVASLYFPLYNAYLSGCVQDGGDGTFVTSNLFTVAYNHAYQDGSSVLVEGVDSFESKRGSTCNSRYASSATMQNDQNSNFSAYQTFHGEVASGMDILQRCVDSGNLDLSFGKACCGIDDFPVCDLAEISNITCPLDSRVRPPKVPMPFEVPGLLLDEPTCAVDISGSVGGGWEFQDSVFDCDAVSACSVTCPGPRRGRLEAVSEVCGCTIEWYFHSAWLEAIMAGVLYLFMNVARISFFAGVTRLLWRHIHPDTFTVSATCTSEGKLVTTTKNSGSPHEDLILAIQTQLPVDNFSEGLSLELNAKLKRSLRNFYIEGAAYVCLSVIMTVIWGFAVSISSRSIAPRVWL